MNATRWSEVERLYHAALERAADERAAFLTEACAGDDDLRHEVESLLAYRTKAEEFIEVPAPRADPVSSAVSKAVRKLHDESGRGRLAGRVLGVYEVKTLIAVGGMGEVYRAVDSRLNRTVAIKTLPTELANDWERRERFKREANVISSLNHPHICTLYDVGTENDILYLVMEYIDGETLERRLERAPLPLIRALEYATQICDALDKAHRSGVVHRDLKPANVMLTRSGVKLLDFGIATRPPAGVAIDSRETASLSLPERLTAEGTILGTLQYLAPEQLEGKSVDARTDIFAFGALVYEMLAGKRAFQAESQAALIGRILRDDPRPIADLVPDVPAALVSSLSRCLSKDPDDRWQSASDLLFQMRAIATGLTSVERDAAQPRHRSRWIERGAWAAIVVASIVATFLWAGNRDRVGIGTHLRSDGSVRASGGPVRFSIAPPAGTAFGAGPWSAGGGINVETTHIALSPDSSHLAFVTTEPSRGTRIWLRPLSALDSTPIPDTEGATSVFWSPDGRSIGFFAGGKLKRLDLSGGGSGVMLSEVPERFGMFGTWGEGSILFASPNGPIFRVSTAGGTPIAQVNSKEEQYPGWPWFLPDGRRFLYLVRASDGNGRVMLADPGKPPIPVVSAISNAQWVDPDYIVFAREGIIVGQRFDTSSGRVSGEPFSIAGPVQYSRSTARATMAASRTGSIVYQSHTDLAQLVWFDRSGKELGAIGSRSDYLGIRISPDGRRLLSARAEPQLGTYDVWALDLTRNVETRLTSDPGSELGGVWLPDGASAIFTAERGGGGGLHLLRKDLTTGAEREFLPGDGTMQLPEDVLADQRLLVFRQVSSSDTSSGMFTIPIDGGAPTQLVSSRFKERNFRFSPDGRFIALTSDESGRSELYIAPFPAMSPKTRVSTGGASQARWSRHSHELFYLSFDGRIVSVPVRTEPSLDVGASATLFTPKGRWPWTDFDVAPDGKRFLAVVPQLSANEQPLTVILNWPSTIGRSTQ